MASKWTFDFTKSAEDKERDVANIRNGVINSEISVHQVWNEWRQPTSQASSHYQPPPRSRKKQHKTGDMTQNESIIAQKNSIKNIENLIKYV